MRSYSRRCSRADHVCLIPSRPLHSYHLAAGHIWTHLCPQSVTMQITCWKHHFNRAFLDWTVEGMQTSGIRLYKPCIRSLRQAVASDTFLAMVAATIDITRVQLGLRFRFVITAIHRPSTESSRLDDRM